MSLGTRRLAAIAVVASALFSACAPVEEQTAQQASASTYCPGPSTLEGIDVSVYQGSVDWNAVHASGRAFAIARVSDGMYIDHTFPANWAGIHDAGMIRGAYQFFRPTHDPVAQADIVISAIGTLGAGDLAPMLDVEVTDGASPSQMNAAIHAWVDRIQSVTGRHPLIYVGSYFWDGNVGTTDFSSYPLVLPAYGPVCPRLPAAWDHWDIHQYSGSGSCPGIGGAVDLDVFNGTLADLNQLAGGMTCTPHCEGTVVVGADCGHGDCGVFGATCIQDSLGTRCAYTACPAIGEADICLSDAHIAHCVNGIPQPPGDCSAYAAFCSTVGSSQARCVSAFCVPTPHDAPVAHDTCWFQNGSQLHCDANGAPTITPCPAGQACSVVGGAHCGAPLCPATGESDVCVDDHVIGHCNGGSVVSAGDCANYGAYCSTAGSDTPRCVSVFCVANAHDAPVAHDICLPNGQRAHCNSGGAVEGATDCDTGTMCVADAMGVRCGTPAADGGVTDAAQSDAASVGGDASRRDANATCDGSSDGGCTPGTTQGACACRAVPARGTPTSWAWIVMGLAAALVQRRRTKRGV